MPEEVKHTVGLLPCPICGNRAFLMPGHRSVWCVTDRCLRMPPRETDVEAIAAWNTRHNSHGSDMQHVAYFDEGEFHWMSGIAPRDCELFAARAALSQGGTP